MVRTQVQLTEEQMAELKARAAEQEVSVSELVRRGVDLLTKSRGALSRAERRERILAVAGRFSSGSDDVAERHDDYLADAFIS